MCDGGLVNHCTIVDSTGGLVNHCTIVDSTEELFIANNCIVCVYSTDRYNPRQWYCSLG